jgi:hydrogenase maturation protease
MDRRGSTGGDVAHSKTLVLGVGNTLLCDEGAGIHALELMRARFHEHEFIEFLDGGTLSFSLAAWIETCDNLLVFDAAELHMSAGAVQVMTNEEMDHFLGFTKRSAHEVGLIDLMDIARLSEALPANRALVGVQPETFDWDTAPSPAVAASLEDMVTRAAELIEQWSPGTLQQQADYKSSTRSRDTDSNRKTVESIKRGSTGLV